MRNFLLLIGVLLIPFLGGAQQVTPPKKEVRAVWLTTIYGLDWPRTPATGEHSRKIQQEELCEILDRLAEANFNTVFFQVRLRGDVLYPSAIEPCSAVLTGKAGKSPGYDPLAFAVAECHKRGLECHAWMVTFPVGNEKTVRSQGRQSVVRRHRNLCKLHRGEWYLDPGVPGTADYLLSLVREIVENYDIDGIHFDYIRYPEHAASFPDKSQYRKAGGQQSLADWRRGNINRLMTRIYDYVKNAKPYVLVSSSPLGKYSRIPQVPNAGWTAYETVFQDPQHWMQAGKHDLVAPMMYYKLRNFFPFLDNWVAKANGRLVVAGLGAYRLETSEGDWTLNDLTDQIDYARYFGASGCAFFRCQQVLGNVKGLYDELKNNYFRYPAQLPPLRWLNDRVPPAPSEIRVERTGAELKLSWQRPAGAEGDLTYTVYYATADTIPYDAARSLLITGIRDTAVYLPVDTARERGFLFSVSASDRYHLESKPSPETYYYLSRYLK